MSDELSFLATRTDLPKQQTADEQAQELAMLRAFFKAWQDLHSIPNEKANRERHEAAVEVLLDHARAIQTLGGNHAT